MWLVDHQMNIELSNYIGEYLAKIPIKESVEIFNINANDENWKDYVQTAEGNYIIGNPPFRGVKERTKGYYLNDTKDIPYAFLGNSEAVSSIHYSPENLATIVAKLRGLQNGKIINQLVA